MYQFSRAIYRELAPHILPPQHGAGASRQPRAGAARVRGRRRADGDRPPLLRPPRAHAVLRHPQLLRDERAGSRPPRRQPLHRLRPALTSSRTRSRRTRPSAASRRSAARRPARARPASACRCRTTATAPPINTSPRPRTGSSRPPDRVFVGRIRAGDARTAAGRGTSGPASGGSARHCWRLAVTVAVIDARSARP